MKKILAIILTIAMLASTCVGLAFTSSAATAKACMLNGGYIQPTFSFEGGGGIADKLGTGAYAISFNLWLVDDASGIQLWSDGGSTRYTVAATYAGANRAGSASAYAADDYAGITWGTTGLVGDMHSVKMILNNGYDAIEIDGAEVWRGNGAAAYWTGDLQIFNTLGNGVAIDDFAISSVDGSNVIYSQDFETGTGAFGEYGGTQVDAVLPKPKPVMTKGWMINSGYAQFDTPNAVGSSYTIAFDLWLADKDSGIQFWADTAASRLTIAGTYAGMDSAGGGSAYAADDFVGFDWGEKIGFASDGWHHVEMQFGVNGSDNIIVDGTEVYHSGKTCNAYWTDKIQVANTLGNGVAIDDLTFTSNETVTFEEGTVNPYNELGTAIDLYKVLPVEEMVMTKGMMINSGYAQFDTPNAAGSSYTISFDLWLADIDSGIQFWADTATSRLTIAGTYVGMDNAGGGSAYAADDFKGITWGDKVGFATSGWHHFDMQFGVNGSDNILMDGIEVYHSGQTCNSYWTDKIQLANTLGNGVAIDNFVVQNNEVVTFEDGTVNPYNEVGTIIDLVVEGDGGTVCRNHVAGADPVRTLEPTCHSTGVDTYYCVICEAEMNSVDVPMIPHNWPSYNSGAVFKDATPDENGIRRWTCKGGCGNYVECAIPATGSYKGEISHYVDFEDAIVANGIYEINNESETQIVEDGVGKVLNGSDQSYNQIWATRNNTDWSVTFDVNVKGTYEYRTVEEEDGTVKVNDGYGHQVHFWFGGANGMANMAGYNFDEGCFFIKPSTGSSYEAIKTTMAFPMNEWVTVTFRFHAPANEDAYWDNGELGWCSIELNGETVAIYDDEFAFYDLIGASADTIIIRDFGVEAEIDNLVIGSSDFAWVDNTIGDVDENGRINIIDMLILKQIVAGNESPMITYSAEKADLNADGRINAADVALLKSKLLGE